MESQTYTISAEEYKFLMSMMSKMQVGQKKVKFASELSTQDLDEMWADRNYFFYDFYQQYSGSNRVFDSYQEACDSQMAIDMLKIARIVTYGPQRLIVLKVLNNQNNVEFVTENLLSFGNTYKNLSKCFYGVRVNGSKTMKIESYWLFYPLIHHVKYHYAWISWIPYSPLEDNPILNHQTLNLYPGFRAKVVDHVNMQKVDPLLKHIEYVISGGDKEVYNYVLSWISDMIKNPRNKMRKCLIVSGGAGTGKKLLFRFLIEYVFGKSICMEINNLNDLTGRFNGHLTNKFFVYIPEMNGTNEYNSIHDKISGLKSLISEESLLIEKKNKDAFIEDNYLHIAGTTDFKPTLGPVTYDRRFVIINAKQHTTEDKNYFNYIHSFFTQEVGDHFYTYLLKLDQDKLPDISNVPQQKTYPTVDLRRKHNSLVFFDDFMNRRWSSKFPIAWEFRRDCYLIPKYILYRVYTDWCRDRNEMATSDNWFSKSITDEHLFKTFRLSNGDRCYMIPSFMFNNPK